MNSMEDLDDETRLARAEDEIQCAIDDYERFLFDAAWLEINNAREYLDGMAADPKNKESYDKMQELYRKIEEYYPKIRDQMPVGQV